MIELIELTTNQLMIVLKDKEELNQLQSKYNEDDILFELFESSRYIGNDWYCNQTIGLTEAPNICKGALYIDNAHNSILTAKYLQYIKEIIFDGNIDFEPKSFKLYLEQDCDVNTELPIEFEYVWYYPYYMTKSFVEELLNNGFVIFEKA